MRATQEPNLNSFEGDIYKIEQVWTTYIALNMKAAKRNVSLKLVSV